MKYAAWFVVASCVAMMYAHWGTAAVYGWVVAFTGWVPHLIPETQERTMS